MNNKIAYINGVLLSGEQDMQPVSGQILFTEGDRIEKILPDGAETAGYEIVDLNGAFLMPGLVNLHVHIPATGAPKKKQSDPKKLVRLLTSNALMRKICYLMCGKYVLPELLSGVTTLRSVGGVQDIDSRLRDEIAAGKRVGPRILAGNMAVSVPGGHMAGSLAYEAHSAEEAAGLVRKIAEGHPDLIKLMITGGVMDSSADGEPGVLRMPPEIVKAACDEAHRLGYKVAAHVESTEGVKVALENGVDTIEHGAKPTAEILRLFKERGAADICTLSPAIPYARFTLEESKANETGKTNGAIVLDGIIQCAKACLENGIPVGLGNDVGCPFVTH